MYFVMAALGKQRVPQATKTFILAPRFSIYDLLEPNSAFILFDLGGGAQVTHLFLLLLFSSYICDVTGTWFSSNILLSPISMLPIT